MSIVTYEVKSQGSGAKIRDYLKYEENLSSRFIKSAAIDKRMWVNGEKVKLNHKLECGDIIKINIEKEESQDINGEDLNIQVVYEDDDLLIVNKPPFMVVHPTKSHQSGTLANGVIYHFRKNNDNSIVRLVSRLDRDTSGLIMIAKNQFSHMNLAKSMEKNLIKKSYMAIVHGNMEKAEGTIDLPIGRLAEETIKRGVVSDGQRSITHYHTVEKFKDAALLQLVLETGRTHQIRVHLSHVGKPIYGDTLYGTEDDSSLIERQALHAYGLSVPHPRTGEILEFSCEIPSDMKELMEKLKNK